jgi:prepilin-type N-terminal cleavage/methylation domain-containing protein
MNNMPKNKGFTLIEIIVSVAIFVIVMTIAIGAVLSAVDANRKAQSINVVINNLNLAVESMVRDLRTGNDYSYPSGCRGQGTCISFEDRSGRTIEYRFIEIAGNSGYIEKNILSVGNDYDAGRITSEEVLVEEAEFKLEGDGNNDGPERILVRLKGYAGTGKTRSDFNIQTVVTSRTLDIND